ncbi:MAG: MFS transporter [Geminicoccaceae bacterium]
MFRRLPPQWRELAPVMLTATMVGMNFSLAIPLLSLALERAGVSSFAIGLNTAAGGCGIFLVAPFVDWFVRRLGVVGCFRLGLLVAALCMLLFPLRVDPWLWFGLRLLLGSMGSLMFVLSEASVNALAPDASRGQVLGVYATLFSLGFVAGPLVLALAGSDGWTPFVLASGMFLLCLWPSGLLAPVQDRLAHGEGERRGLSGVWRAAPLALGGVFVYALLEATQFALLPVYALAQGMSEGMAAAALSIWLSGNILFQYPLGWLADRTSRRAVMLGCTVLAFLGQSLLHGVVTMPALLWPLLVALGGLMGGLYTMSLALIGERFRGSDLTAANTAFVMTFQLGTIVGPPYAGAAMQATEIGIFPFTLLLPLLALGGGILAGMRRP